MSDDRERLDRAARGFEPDPRGWSRVQKRVAARRRGRRIVAGTVALGLTAGSFAFLVQAFRGGSSQGTSTASGTDVQNAEGISGLDPDTICDVPTYDPDVTLLVGGNDSIEYPKSVLEGDGEPVATIQGPATDQLRDYVDSNKHAPTDGWRTIASRPHSVTFAAPENHSEWWVVTVGSHGGGWGKGQAEIVDQRPTPAQLGHDMALTWDEEITLQDGRWNEPLRLTNDRDSAWTQEDGSEYWGIVHLFDPATGREVGDGSDVYSSSFGKSYDIEPGEGIGLPVALGGTGTALLSGSYTVVACVPGLGLASPPGILGVVDGPANAEGTVLTYPFPGFGMQALGGGILTMHNGCLATGSRPSNPRPTYVYDVWPEGYALVERGDRTVLVDPVGEEVGALGDKVRLGGGFFTPEEFDSAAIGGVPDACRDGGVEGYFLVGSVEMPQG